MKIKIEATFVQKGQSTQHWHTWVFRM